MDDRRVLGTRRAACPLFLDVSSGRRFVSGLRLDFWTCCTRCDVGCGYDTAVGTEKAEAAAAAVASSCESRCRCIVVGRFMELDALAG